MCYDFSIWERKLTAMQNLHNLLLSSLVCSLVCKNSGSHEGWSANIHRACDSKLFHFALYNTRNIRPYLPDWGHCSTRSQTWRVQFPPFKSDGMHCETFGNGSECRGRSSLQSAQKGTSLCFPVLSTGSLVAMLLRLCTKATTKEGGLSFEISTIKGSFFTYKGEY